MGVKDEDGKKIKVFQSFSICLSKVFSQYKKKNTCLNVTNMDKVDINRPKNHLLDGRSKSLLDGS